MRQLTHISFACGVSLALLCGSLLLTPVTAQCVTSGADFCGCCNYCAASTKPTWNGPSACDCSQYASCTTCGVVSSSCRGDHEGGCSGNPQYSDQCLCEKGYDAKNGGCEKHKDHSPVVIILVVLAVLLVAAVVLCVCWYHKRNQTKGFAKQSDIDRKPGVGNGRYNPPGGATAVSNPAFASPLPAETSRVGHSLPTTTKPRTAIVGGTGGTGAAHGVTTPVRSTSAAVGVLDTLDTPSPSDSQALLKSQPAPPDFQSFSDSDRSKASHAMLTEPTGARRRRSRGDSNDSGLSVEVPDEIADFSDEEHGSAVTGVSTRSRIDDVVSAMVLGDTKVSPRSRWKGAARKMQAIAALASAARRGGSAESVAGSAGSEDVSLRYQPGLVAFMKQHIPFMPASVDPKSSVAKKAAHARHVSSTNVAASSTPSSSSLEKVAEAAAEADASGAAGAGAGAGAGGGGGAAAKAEAATAADAPPEEDVLWLEELGPVHLLWGIFFFYAATGDPTRSTTIGLQKFRHFCRDAGVLPQPGRPRRRPHLNGATVDLVFTKKTKSKGAGPATLRATHSELRTYAETGRKGVMSFVAFHSACRALSRSMYPPPADSYETFFERHIIPLCLAEGNKLLEQGDRALISGYSKGLSLHEEMSAIHRPEVAKLLEVNATPLGTIFRAYTNRGSSSGLRYTELLTFAHDFSLVPRLADMTQLLDLFAAVNISDDADDLVDVLSYDEFVSLLALFALRFTPPTRKRLSAAPGTPKMGSPIRSVQRLLIEMENGGGKDKLVATKRGVGSISSFVGIRPNPRGSVTSP